MALSAWTVIKAQRQGDIKSASTMKDRVGKIETIAVSHEIVSPRDPASGMPTGKRSHKPKHHTYELGPHVPLLLSALASNENLPSVVTQYYAPDPQGSEKLVYTVTLTNASIASISFNMANNKHTDLMKLAVYCTVAFCYQKIEWTYNNPNVAAADDWLEPNVTA